MALRVMVGCKRVIDYAVKLNKFHEKTLNLRVKIENGYPELVGILREKKVASEVIAVSCGPQKCQETLRTALAMGADKAIHVDISDKDYVNLQPLQVSKILAKLALDNKIDLLIVGKQAIDDDANQTAQMTAAQLDWPQATFVSKVEKNNGELDITREVDGGLEMIKVKIPAVLSADLRLNEPRYATLPNIMKAKKKPLEKKTVAELGIDISSRIEILKVEDPPTREAGTKVENVDQLIEKLKERDVMHTVKFTKMVEASIDSSDEDIFQNYAGKNGIKPYRFEPKRRRLNVDQHAIVLGGGISGLATAYYLRKLAGQTVSKVILIEKSKRFGGWVNSYYDNNNGVVHELGPRSIRFRATGTVGCNTLQLIEDLNLSDEVLKVTEKEANVNKRYILHKGKIIEMPNSKFFATPPFKKSLFHYALKDLFASKPKVDDESLYNFFSKRYGHEISDVFIDPLCRGIVAGDAKEISVRSLFPLYFKAAKERGSLILGMMSENKKNAREVRSLNSALCYKASTERWSMWNLRKGLNQLPDALENWLKNDKHVQVISESSCDRIQFSDGCTKVYTGNECFEGKHVVSCLPSFELSKTIAHDHPDLASVLDRIKFVNVAVINFEFTGSVLPIKTFGYLIPSSDPSKVLGVVFDSCNFSKHDGHDENDTDRTRLTCMLGGHWFNEYFGDVETVDENILLETSLHELKTRLNITEKPVRYHITVQKNCIPQYKVGHHEIVDCLKTMLQEKKLPLSISGSSFEGVSVNDVIYNSRTNIEDLDSSSSQVVTQPTAEQMSPS
ncbi:Protoporphyrinogen oxidase [Nymphon striatum]|nr:Protoporphyrinogen oxidase [Nymphon striatum]